MIRDIITVEDAVEVLNSALQLDRAAIAALIESRVLCNMSLANHPTIQVRCFPGSVCRVGLLGVLNGLFGIADDGFGAIAASFEVQCPHYCKLSHASVSVGESCPECGAELKLGQIQEFRRIR